MLYIKKLKILLHSNGFFLFLASLSILYALGCRYVFSKESEIPLESTTFSGILTKVQQKGEMYQLEVSGSETILVTYFAKAFPFHLGDCLLLEGTMSLPKNSALFDYETYLKAKDIYRLFFAEKIVLEKANENLFYQIKDVVSSRVMNSSVKGYMRAFLLGDGSFLEEDARSSFQKNGVNHLFAVSGMHVSFFATFLLWLLKKLRWKEFVSYIVVLLFLFFYLFLVNYIPSAMRSICFFTLMACNKTFSWKFTMLQLMLLTLFVLLLLHPYYLFHAGFQFSYAISFGLIWYGSQGKKGVGALLKTSLLSFFIGLPILLFHYYECNVLSIVWNLLFVPLVSSVIFPLTLLIFFFPIFEFPLSLFILILEVLSNVCQGISFGVFSFMKLPKIVYFIYAFLIFGMLSAVKKRRKSFSFLLFPILICFHFFYPYFDSRSFLVMIDVGQGDCVLLKAPYQKGNILIDTGGKMTGKSSIAQKNILPLFKALGIKQLDYMILSHGDADHMGESFEIVESFPVKTVFFNPGTINSLEEKLLSILKNRRISYYFLKKGHILRVADWKFEFLNETDVSSENEDSLVFLLNTSLYKILFTGDIGVKTEEKLLSSLEDVDLLKVAHHGSKGSTSRSFLEIVKPKYALISVSDYNHFGHPSPIVLELLNESGIEVWQTNLHGSIYVDLSNFSIRTLRI